MPRFPSIFVTTGLVFLVAGPLPSLGAASPRGSSGQLEFRWIDLQRDSAAWDQIRTAFSDELRPEKVEENEPTYGYKYVRQVGIGGESALVIIGYRFSEKPPEFGTEHFRAFSYNLRTRELSQVVDPEHERYSLYMWEWRFVKLARFEPSTLPDIVFTYLTCGECEEEKILAAFRYDSGSQKWQIRQFGEGEPRWWMTKVGLVVDKDTAFTAITSYKCPYSLTDLNGDGLDDVAIRCREVEEDERKKTHLTDSTVLYSLKSGRFAGEIVTTRDQQLKIWAALCEHSTRNALCRGIGNTSKPPGPANAKP